MKTIILCTLFSLALVSCAENQFDVNGNMDREVSLRTVSDVAYFYDGLGNVITYNQITDEYEIDIEEDFEYRPYGDLNWYPVYGIAKVKVKCKCRQTEGEGGCNPWSNIISDDDVSVGCDDPCTAGCKLKSRITNAVGSTISEFEHGAEFRLQ